MGLFDRLFARNAKPQPVSGKGSQKTYDLEGVRNLTPLWGIQHPQDLTSYRNYYLEHFLARRIVNALTRLTLSDIKTASEDADLDKMVSEFNRGIGLREVLASMLCQLFCYGSTYAEIVYDSEQNPTDVVKIHTCDSRSMRIDLDPLGNVRSFVQLPSFFGIKGSGEPIHIPPESMIFLRYSPLGDSIYGSSILQPIVEQLKQSSALLIAMVKSALRAVQISDLYSYQAAEGENTDEVAQAVNTFIGAIDEAEPGDPLVFGGSGEMRRQSPAQNNPSPLSKELEAVLSAAVSGAELTAQACGLDFGSSVSSNAEARIVMLGMIESVQSQITEQLNLKLYRPLSDIWNTDEIYVQMSSPILLSEKERAEKETIDLNNSGLKAKMGVVNGQQLAQELGYDELADETRFEKWLDSGATLAEQRNPADNNTVQQDTKTTQDNQPPKPERPN